MRTVLVVIAPPRLTFYPCVVQAQEPVCVEAFGPNAAIERLRERIVGRLAGAAEVQDYVMLIGPQIEILRDEFRAIVPTNALRTTMCQGNAVERIDYVRSAIDCPYIERWRHTGEVVDDRQQLRSCAR